MTENELIAQITQAVMDGEAGIAAGCHPPGT